MEAPGLGLFRSDMDQKGGFPSSHGRSACGGKEIGGGEDAGNVVSLVHFSGSGWYDAGRPTAIAKCNYTFASLHKNIDVFLNHAGSTGNLKLLDGIGRLTAKELNYLIIESSGYA